ncbi:guanosine-3',5'-bis(diphosphate) 3'-pyrophosphohydrolase MESH1 [Sitodiplosis mosellana]|uniref:guanosine-3',5'-bis(diphosphate) 3'-pyrophosphohydrolase MESH1 n=1 Tax=Sitodiplosis mosellana TaxID=263140 RepID=UPI0024446746|nr:guanosine-3',5'-bis(diphosphate) 3'-pyrophosphohydrolase MESH1 [Sitodiplosis mosellana]
MFDPILYTKCIDFAARKHRDQRRKDPEKTPYINHPIGVAYLLTEANVVDQNVLMAAILHDTVEDTKTTFDEIEKHFGKAVRDIVDEVTDDKLKPKQERKRLQIVHAKGASHEAKLVKLADKLYNLRDLERTTPAGWTQERREDYFVWAKEVTDNLRGTNEQLENALDEIYKNQNLV